MPTSANLHLVLSLSCVFHYLILSSLFFCFIHSVPSSYFLTLFSPFFVCPVFSFFHTLSCLQSHCPVYPLSHTVQFFNLLFLSCLLTVFLTVLHSNCLTLVFLSYSHLPVFLLSSSLCLFFFQVFLFCFQTMPCPLSHLPLLCFSHSLMLPLSCLSHSVISFDYLHHFVISFVSLFSFS